MTQGIEKMSQVDIIIAGVLLGLAGVALLAVSLLHFMKPLLVRLLNVFYDPEKE